MAHVDRKLGETVLKLTGVMGFIAIAFGCGRIFNRGDGTTTLIHDYSGRRFIEIDGKDVPYDPAIHGKPVIFFEVDDDLKQFTPTKDPHRKTKAIHVHERHEGTFFGIRYKWV